MKLKFLSVLAIFLFTSIAGAQVPAAPPSVPGSTPAVPAANELAPGTILSVELSKSLDAKKLKANDRFEARTSVDLLEHGQIVVPRNTKIMGHVTEVKAHSSQSPDSMVGIRFERAVMKDGRELPLQVTVQAIARPLQAGSAFPSDDQIGGIPSAADNQRGARIGPTAPSTNGYPQIGGSGLPSDPRGPEPSGTTVSPLGPTSKGVVGIKGLSLDSSGSVSVVSSKTDNVRLDGGTQLILRAQ